MGDRLKLRFRGGFLGCQAQFVIPQVIEAGILLELPKLKLEQRPVAVPRPIVCLGHCSL
jgi:hypothetical protein